MAQPVSTARATAAMMHTAENRAIAVAHGDEWIGAIGRRGAIWIELALSGGARLALFFDDGIRAPATDTGGCLIED
jgi:hypothetical protein